MITSRGRVLFSLWVCVLSIAGACLAQGFRVASESGAASFFAGFGGMLLGLVWVWWVSVPTLAMYFGALFAATLPFRRARWWVSLLAGLAGIAAAYIATMVPDLIGGLTGSTSSWGYVGTPSEIHAAETRDLIATIVFLAWCLGASLACTRLLTVPSRRPPLTSSEGDAIRRGIRSL